MSGSESLHRLRVDLPAPGSDGPVDSVALITLDRPEVLNALDAETMRQLVETLEGLDADWRYFLTMDVTMGLTEEAGELAERYGLRGFDSLHLASFASIARSAGPEIQFSSFDDRLNRGAKSFLISRRRQ